MGVWCFLTLVSGVADTISEEDSTRRSPFYAVQCRMGLTLAEKLITLLEAWVSHDTVEEAISSRKTATRRSSISYEPTMTLVSLILIEIVIIALCLYDTGYGQ